MPFCRGNTTIIVNRKNFAKSVDMLSCDWPRLDSLFSFSRRLCHYCSQVEFVVIQSVSAISAPRRGKWSTALEGLSFDILVGSPLAAKPRSKSLFRILRHTIFWSQTANTLSAITMWIENIVYEIAVHIPSEWLVDRSCSLSQIDTLRSLPIKRLFSFCSTTRQAILSKRC